jgi:predicted nucleic acid-binding protein
MTLVVDANVVLSALIADSRTRELLVTLEQALVTPEVVHDEIYEYEELVVEKSGMNPDRVQQFVDLLFEHVETVPVEEFHTEIGRAEAALYDTDPDDMLYLACALGRDAAIWSDDTDFQEQELVPEFTTIEVVETFETV